MEKYLFAFTMTTCNTLYKIIRKSYFCKLWNLESSKSNQFYVGNTNILVQNFLQLAVFELLWESDSIHRVMVENDIFKHNDHKKIRVNSIVNPPRILNRLRYIYLYANHKILFLMQ